MPPVVPNNLRFQPLPTTQLLCPQDFARNPFRFIDLAGIPSTRLNRFIDLRQKAIFFRSDPWPYLYPHIPTFVNAPTSKSPDSNADHPPCAASSSVTSTPA